jgi:hypothetical protein
MYIQIPVNKKRFPYILAAAVAGVIFSLLGIIYHLHHDSGNELFIMYLPAYVPIFIIALYYAIISFAEYRKTLFDNTAKLVITDEGIEDNLSIFSCGKVNWGSILNAGIATMDITEKLRIRHLVIPVASPSSFIEQKPKWKRWVLKRYIKRWGSPFVIPAEMINYKLEELQQIILHEKMVHISRLN